MGKKYESICRASDRHEESNDCSVKAIAIAARVPYKTAHQVLSRLGRRPHQGVVLSTIYTALRYLGVEIERHLAPRQKNGSRYTMSTIGKYCRRGYWIALTCDHAAAIVNGEVEDWTESRRHRVLAVIKVTVPRGSRS